MQRRLLCFGPARAVIGVALVVVLAGCAGHGQQPSAPKALGGEAGHPAANRYLVPTGQVLTPAGRQVDLPGMRPQALALSPDGRLLATAGRKNVLVLIDPATGQVLQTIPLSIPKNESATPASAPARSAATNSADLSFTGLVFSPDGRCLYLSNVNGNVWMLAVDGARVVGPPAVLPVPNAKAPGQKREIPAGLAVSADGKQLYVAGNLSSRLYELDALTSSPLRSWNTGSPLTTLS